MSVAATMVSPSFPFPGPPPPPSPYSHAPAGPSNGPPPQNGLISPPESRRTSGDEPPSVPTTRQSLPSISEALGGADPTLPFPPHVAPPTHSTSSYFPPAPRSTVADIHRSSITSGPPPEPPHSYPSSHPQSPYMNRGPPVQAPHTPTAQDPYARPPYPAQPPKLPTLQPIKTDNSPTASFRPPIQHPPQHPSPAYETPPHSAPSQAPYPYPGGYQPQGYQYSHPAGPAGPGPLYPPSGAQAPPRDYGRPGPWDNGHMDERARAPPGMPVPFHGESVKRHLDDFDLEASLNEVAECSGKMLEFTREYGIRNHGGQRAGLSPRSIPHLQTVEELMQKSRRIEDSLKRIREMVIAQNHAMEQQMKDSGRSGPGSYSDMNGSYDDKQGMGGFAGGDTKKRRGRAAPPGRCHSCNRAETPEWRRGPDGARTLCNACGLHYAKLTRKMGGKGQIGSSNLRPKSES